MNRPGWPTTGSPPALADPFDTASLRSVVLAAWAASSARFREDANAEEDLVHGAYRDRLLVELAQNAADAAARAGVPGVLRLRLQDGELRAANTGAPLDAAGVQALATLRASAKRDAEVTTVGRFGVGFAAVLAVTDDPAIVSSAGGVRFSAEQTARALAGIPTLAEELHRRSHRVPVLRLPFPEPGSPPPGFATEVRLPLRPGSEQAVQAALDELDGGLLLALPALVRIEAGGRTLARRAPAAPIRAAPPSAGRPDWVTAAAPSRAGARAPAEAATSGLVELQEGSRSTRWLTRSVTGRLPAMLLAGRPVEERERPDWTVTWAVPVDLAGVPQPLPGRQVVHCPTPSEEPVSLPALLVASFPLGPDRRHVAPGAISDLLVAEAASCYAALLADAPASPALLSLVPRPGLVATELDAALCRAVFAALRGVAWLPTTGPGTAPATGADGASLTDRGPVHQRPAAALPAAVPPRVRPDQASVVDSASPALVEVLAGVLPGLLPAEWSGRGQAAPLTAVGVRRLSTTDVVELVSGIERPPAWWARLYAGLTDAADREALAALPVPLADGRTVTGVRGLLLPDASLPAASAGALGVRVVHPEAVRPLLERLGALPATPASVLRDERVRAAVEASYDEEDPEPIASAVLALVAAAGLEPGELAWLSELALPGADGDWYPASELLLAGSPLADVVDPAAPFGIAAPELARRWGEEVLRAVGVLDTFAVLRLANVELGEGDHDLDGEQDWHEAVLHRLPPQSVPPRLAELVAVRDLELVGADRWERALRLIAALPDVTTPAAAVLDDGRRIQVPSYTRWWLATHPVLGGVRPSQLRLPAAAELAGLYEAADPSIPSELAVFAGCLTGLADLLDDPDRALGLLRRLADPARTAPAATLRTIYARLALALDGYQLDPPPAVRVAPHEVAPLDRAVVLDAPYLLPLLTRFAIVPASGAPGPVADLLGLPFASELVSARVVSSAGRRRRWSEVPGVVLAAERCGGAVPAGEVAEHDPLLVTGGARVDWWPGWPHPEAGGSGSAAAGAQGSALDAGGTPDALEPAGAVDAVDAAAGVAALGRVLAWRLGRWEARAAAVEALARPAAGYLLRAEDAAGESMTG